ncbi:MAG: Fic family protein [Nitrososphaerota archaeon]|jgi:Fic family protein|nr:Fic family protein [Nitrososphaerota archaeon]
MSNNKPNFTYRLEQRITKNNRTQHYIVKDIKINGEKRKITKYIGQRKPTDAKFKQLCQKHAHEIENRAIEKKAIIRSGLFKTKHLDKETINKLELLRSTYKQLNKWLTANEVAVYEQDFEVKYVHGTTVIEGNTLSLKQTHDLLINGILPNDKKLREINEIQNFINVKNYRDNYTGKVTVVFIKKLHALIMNNIDFDSAGKFRRIDDIDITGCDFMVTPSELIEEELTKLVEKYYSALEEGYYPFEEAVLFHYNFEMIHPFTDGNGRVGRELFNYMLNEKDYPRFLFLGSERENYLKMLRLGNEEDYQSMVIKFAQLIIAQKFYVLLDRFEKYLTHMIEQ